jgi:hypothetical protein
VDVPSLSSYTVVVYYREPTYEVRHGDKAEPYQFTYEVMAVDEDDARAAALAQFRATADDSQVGWVRQVLQVIVTRTAPAGDRR